MAAVKLLLRRRTLILPSVLPPPPPISAAFATRQYHSPLPPSPLFNPSAGIGGGSRPLALLRPFSSSRSLSWYSSPVTQESGGEDKDAFDDVSAIAAELSDSEEGLWYLPMVRQVVSLLDGFHDLTALPWWAVIITSTLAFRAVLLPVLILQLKRVGEIAAIFPKLPPPLPPPLSGRSFQEQYRLFQQKRRELGCPSFLWNFAFLSVQFPCFLLWMTSIRRMCLDHHPGFDTGGTLWFQNLIDFPHGILGSVFPLLIAGLHYTNIQISFHGSNVAKMPGIFGLLAKYYKLYLDILAIPMFLIGFHVPQGSLVYWVTNSLLTSVQIISLRNPHIRNMLGLPGEKAHTKNVSQENMVHQNNASLEHRIFADSLPPQELLHIALGYLAAGHLDDALKLLRLATDKDPELVRALIAMGEIFCTKGSLVEASDYFERAIPKIQELDLEEDLGLLVLATYGAGFSLMSLGKKLEGIQHLKRIGQLREPEDPMNKACYYRGLVLLGSMLYEDGEKLEALKYLRRAAAYDPAVNALVKECED